MVRGEISGSCYRLNLHATDRKRQIENARSNSGQHTEAVLPANPKVETLRPKKNQAPYEMSPELSALSW